MTPNRVRAWLAIIITLAVFACLPPLLTGGQIAERDPFMVIIGAILMRLADAFNYYFGSSDGSARKTELLAAATPPPPTVQE